MGVEPTAFPGLSRDGLPVAYLAESILGGIRTHDLHRERVAATTPGPLGPRQTKDKGPMTKDKRVAQVGFEPTASFSLKESGLPVAYRAVALPSCQRSIGSVPGVGVEPTRTGSKPASLPLADPGGWMAGFEPAWPGSRSRWMKPLSHIQN